MSEPDEADRDALVSIARVYSQPEAAVLFATLQAYGFVTFRFDDNTLYVAPGWMVAMGGIRIMVPRDQRDDAIALLAEIDEGWKRPPPAFSDETWISWATSLIVFAMCTVAPPPGIRGEYAWRGRQAGSGSSPR